MKPQARVIRWVMVGAAGRMGRQLITCARDNPALRLVGAVDRVGSDAIGFDAGEVAGGAASGVRITSDLDAALAAGADLAIDFSDATAVTANLQTCAARGVAVLVGTTGLPVSVEEQARGSAHAIPLMIAANTSLGVTVLAALVEAVARALPHDFDIEIVEAHHRLKKDAPSGTALALGRAAAAGRGRKLEDIAAGPREGLAPRREGEIGFAVVRGGDIVGDHSVLFAGPAERLTLAHQATDRAVFARGALRAGEWLASQPAGRYSMADFLNVKQYLAS